MNTLKHAEFDAIIVGSGPGGGSVAKELSKRGLKTLILERGQGEPIRGTAAQLIPMALIPGKSLHFTQQMLGLIHGITVGGSSVIFYANAFDPPYEMFESYGIDLRPEIDEAKQELPIAPLSDDLIGPAAKGIPVYRTDPEDDLLFTGSMKEGPLQGITIPMLFVRNEAGEIDRILIQQNTLYKRPYQQSVKYRKNILLGILGGLALFFLGKKKLKKCC